MGHVGAMYRVGTIYLRHVDHTPPNMQKARQYFEDAVKKGAHAPSQYELACMNYYEEQDLDQVVPLIKASVAQDYPPAMTLLGDLYRYRTFWVALS